MMHEFKSHKVVLDRGCFMTIADACMMTTSTKTTDTVARWLLEILNTGQFAAGDMEYAQLAKVLVECKLLDEAVSLLSVADKRGVTPNVFMYASLLKGLLRVHCLMCLYGHCYCYCLLACLSVACYSAHLFVNIQCGHNYIHQK